MNGLNICKASAGSGKTFKLTEEYLKIIFEQKGKFSNILAVTFTNKATAEMQDRILKELYLLSSNKESAHLETLCKHLNISQQKVREYAQIYLKQILHNYSFFNISTIDSFFQKILKAFVREIGINTGFNIELSNNIVIEKAVEQLLSELQNNKNILQLLESFAFDKMQKASSWDIHKDLISFSQTCFNEVFLSLNDNYIHNLTFKNFNTLNSELNNITSNFIKQVRQFGNDFCNKLKEHNLSIDDFSYKKSGVAGYFNKIQNSTIKDFAPYGKRVLDAANSEDSIKGWTSNTANNKFDIQACVNSGLQQITKDYIKFIDENKELFYTAIVTKDNLISFAVFTEIYKHILQYCNDNNLFLLSMTSPLLSKMINEQDAPFIYEKTGTFIHHFMIDEFQDTSEIQWKNFSPLVTNSIAQGDKTLIVGDVKQAIYRWRNGNWDLLSNKIQQQFKNFKPTEQNLEYNWRSLKNIITFNNAFFDISSKTIQQYNAEYLQGNECIKQPSLNIEKIYDNSSQNIPNKTTDTEGYIKLHFIEKEKGELKEETTQKRLNFLHNVILQLADSGYKAKDIAILIRKKDEGQKVAEHLIKLSKENPENADLYNFVSDESLNLNSSEFVNLIVLLIKWLHQPNNSMLKAQIIQLYSSLCYDIPTSIQQLNTIDLTNDEQFFASLPTEFGKQSKLLKQYTIPNITQELIKIFFIENEKLQNKFNNHIAFIQTFQDLVLSYTQKNGNNIEEFTLWWETEGQSKSINISDEQDAIRIMTIHKSKGLEFKVVIMPFADWDISNSKNKPIIWCNTNDNKPFNNFSIFPITYSEALSETIFKNDYYQEYLKQIIDNINLLYVGFTRARNALFIFSKHSVPDKTPKISNTAQIISLTAPNINGATTNEDENIYEWGTLPKIEASKTTELNHQLLNYKLSKPNKQLKIKMEGKDIINSEEENSQIINGKIYHKIFEYITTTKSIDNAVSKVIQMGLIDTGECQNIINQITEYINNTNVSDWFSDNWSIKNERSILLPSGEQKRPDRVIENKNKIIVIDYKFTSIEHNKYKKQVKEYIQALKQISNKTIEGYIWYVPACKTDKV